jgi:hypothetical protein
MAASCSPPAKEDPPPTGPGTSPAATATGQTPEQTLYQQLRSGSFQLGAAVISIEDTYKAANEAQTKLRKFGNAQSAMQDVLDFLDSAGKGVAEYSDVPPAPEEVAKAFADFDEARLKAIESANDSLHDLREALGILEGLASEPGAEVAQAAISVKSLLAVAIDDVWGAIEALGGVPEASDEPLNP